MAEYSEILYEKQRKGVLISFNRPAAMNAISRTLLKELGDALDKAVADPEVRKVVLTGVGSSPKTSALCGPIDLAMVGGLTIHLAIREDTMGCKKYLIALWLVYGWIAFGSVGLAAPQFESVTIGYSSFSGAYVPLWIAVEERLGKKYSLDLKAVYAGRIRPQQLLVSGEAPFVVATGTGALTSHAVGLKDQVIILTFLNKVGSAIFSKTEIKNPEELKGKTIATGRPGAFADTMVRYVLRGKLGLLPDRDVKLLPVGEAALTLPALERRVVDAASLSIPYTLIARKMGFRELVDYDKIGIIYPYNTVTTLRTTLSKSPELVEKVLKTMIEGVSVFKTNKEKSLAVMRKYMRGASEDILEETYQYTRGVLEEVPTPSLQVIKTALEIISLQYPEAKQIDPNLIIDPSLVRRIDQSGFIGALYRK